MICGRSVGAKTCEGTNRKFAKYKQHKSSLRLLLLSAMNSSKRTTSRSSFLAYLYDGSALVCARRPRVRRAGVRLTPRPLTILEGTTTMKYAVLIIAVLALGVAMVTGTTFAQEKAAGVLKVAEAKLGTDVQNKAIVGEDSTFALNGRVYLWLKITGGPADSISVSWKHEEHSYAAKLGIGGSPWRTWAYKTVAFPGEWTVTIEGPDGTVLKQIPFTVKASGKM